MVLMGNRKWIKEKNLIEISGEVESRLIAQEQLGHTAILAAIDGKKFLIRFSSGTNPINHYITAHCITS